MLDAWKVTPIGEPEFTLVEVNDHDTLAGALEAPAVSTNP